MCYMVDEIYGISNLNANWSEISQTTVQSHAKDNGVPDHANVLVILGYVKVLVRCHGLVERRFAFLLIPAHSFQLSARVQRAKSYFASFYEIFRECFVL